MTDVRTERILRLSRVVSDLDRAEAFYRDALGFRLLGRSAVAPAVLTALGVQAFAAEQALMRLGAEDMALIRFAPAGRPYPAESRSDDLWFQHIAIVVQDMAAAYAHLGRHGGWSPISRGGPQRLPPANGAVRAFKFRDPDGHPVELIWFPPGQGRAVWHGTATGGPFLGIDHSALSVSRTARSLAFYRRLGLAPAARSWNHGAPQAALDGLFAARARVIGLRPASPLGMGIELLRYVPPGRPMPAARPNDGLTDWLTLGVRRLGRPSRGPSFGALRDPDGHLIVLEVHGPEGAPTGAPA